MKKRRKKSGQGTQGLYETYPLAAAGGRNPATNTTVPPEDGVKESKDWVDFNKK